MTTSQVERPDLGPFLLLRKPRHCDRGALVAKLFGDLRPGEAIEDEALLVPDDGHLDAVDGDVGLEPGVRLGVERREETIHRLVPQILGLGHGQNLGR